MDESYQIINSCRRAVWLIGLFLFASFGSIVGGFFGPLSYILCFVFPKCKYIENVARASDRLDAALLGLGNGRHMVSTELAYSGKMTWLRRILVDVDKDHCTKSAVAEGAYCRWSAAMDRKHGLGDK